MLGVHGWSGVLMACSPNAHRTFVSASKDCTSSPEAARLLEPLILPKATLHPKWESFIKSVPVFSPYIFTFFLPNIMHTSQVEQ